MKRLLTLCTLIYCHSSFSCTGDTAQKTLSQIDYALANRHGSDWKAVSQVGCDHKFIQNRLITIVTDHEKELSEHNTNSTRPFLYRNAIFGIGVFASLGSPDQGLELLKDIYINPGQYLKGMYHKQHDYVKGIIVTAIANTGNADALAFFTDIVESDDTPLYLIENIHIEAQKVLKKDSSKPLPIPHGLQPYYPNLTNDLFSRYPQQEHQRLWHVLDRFEATSQNIRKRYEHNPEFKYIQSAVENYQNEYKKLVAKHRDKSGGMDHTHPPADQGGDHDEFSSDKKSPKYSSQDGQTKDRQIASTDQEQQIHSGSTIALILKIAIALMTLILILGHLIRKKL